MRVKHRVRREVPAVPPAKTKPISAGRSVGGDTGGACPPRRVVTPGPASAGPSLSPRRRGKAGAGDARGTHGRDGRAAHGRDAHATELRRTKPMGGRISGKRSQFQGRADTVDPASAAAGRACPTPEVFALFIRRGVVGCATADRGRPHEVDGSPRRDLALGAPRPVCGAHLGGFSHVFTGSWFGVDRQ